MTEFGSLTEERSLANVLGEVEWRVRRKREIHKAESCKDDICIFYFVGISHSFSLSDFGSEPSSVLFILVACIPHRPSLDLFDLYLVSIRSFSVLSFATLPQLLSSSLCNTAVLLNLSSSHKISSSMVWTLLSSFCFPFSTFSDPF